MEEICCNIFTCVYMKGICSHEGINFTSQNAFHMEGNKQKKTDVNCVSWCSSCSTVLLLYLHLIIKSTYCISMIRHPRLLFFAAGSCVAAIQGRLLFKGGIYFLEKPAEINNSWIRHVKTIQGWRCQYSSQSHWVLLSAVEMSRTTRTALALAW